MSLTGIQIDDIFMQEKKRCDMRTTIDLIEHLISLAGTSPIDLTLNELKAHRAKDA